MSTSRFIEPGDTLFLMHRKVIVTKVYLLFQFITVRYLDDINEFCVDVFALSDSPDFTNSISLGLIGGKI